MRFLTLEPMLQSADIAATIAWYRDRLGFELSGRMEDNWCRLERDGVAIMFMTNAHLGAPAATATQYFAVDDVMALYNRLKDHVAVEWGPEQMPYDMLEFAIRDNNGYLLSFGQDTSSQS